MKKYLDKLNDIQAKYDNDLQELGLCIRNEVIVPICKRHNYKFISGNGSYYFTEMDDGNITLAKNNDDMISVFNLLNTTVDEDKDITIGDYVGQVE